MTKTLRSRRRFLAAAAAVAVAAGSRAAQAQVALQDIAPVVAGVTGGAQVRPGRVSLELPRLADNGHSVPLKIGVSSPMTEGDFVKSVHVIAERNPRPLVAAFHLYPDDGRAEVVTRIRLAASQRVLVIAAMSDGSFWSGTADVEVTETACLDATS